MRSVCCVKVHQTGSDGVGGTQNSSLYKSVVLQGFVISTCIYIAVICCRTHFFRQSCPMYHITSVLAQTLASYFLLIPLRDEIGILLGTNTLPKLFMASLLVTLIAQPLASTLVTSSWLSRQASLRRFFRLVSGAIVVFAILFWCVCSSTDEPPLRRRHR